MTLLSFLKNKAKKSNRISLLNLSSIPESNACFDSTYSGELHDSLQKGKSDSAYIEGYTEGMPEIEKPVEPSECPPEIDDGFKLFADERKPLCLDDFILVKVLGKGSFGKVTLCQHRETKKYYALKVLSKPNVLKKKQIEHTRTERKVFFNL
jgi:hypothetical protein